MVNGMKIDNLQVLRERGLADPLLSQAEVCELMQVSAATLYRMRRSGAGPAWVKLGGTIRYRHSAVLEYLANAEAANT